MIPLLLATNTRPSGAKRITVGLPSPLQTVVSLKPAGSVPASAAAAIGALNGHPPEPWCAMPSDDPQKRKRAA